MTKRALGKAGFPSVRRARDRCHRILGMIEGSGGLPAGEANALRATLEAWMREARRLESELESQKKLTEEWRREASNLREDR